MLDEGPPTLERALLLHLLAHRGHQVRFEADQWTTEFGIFRAFSGHDATSLKAALRTLEMSRLVYRRVQYVIGYSEPKLIYSLTPTGHRKAVDLQREPGNGFPDSPAGGGDPASGSPGVPPGASVGIDDSSELLGSPEATPPE